MAQLICDGSFLEGFWLVVEGGKPIFSEVVPLGPLAKHEMSSYLEKILRTYPIEAVAFGIGPGSYTGMRVVASLLLPLVYALKIPLVTFSSLEGIIPADQTIPWVAVADGKRGCLYGADLVWRGEWIHSPVKLSPIEFFKEKNLVSPHPLTDRYSELNPAIFNKVFFDPDHLAHLVSKRFKLGALTNPFEVDLLYLQEPRVGPSSTLKSVS